MAEEPIQTSGEEQRDSATQGVSNPRNPAGINPSRVGLSQRNQISQGCRAGQEGAPKDGTDQKISVH